MGWALMCRRWRSQRPGHFSIEPGPTTAVSRGWRHMSADSNSNVAWHRVQLKKNRDALKAIEITRFRLGQMAGSSAKARQEEIASLKRKIAESERCIAVFERQPRRPLATDFSSLTQVRWSNWNTRPGLARH